MPQIETAQTIASQNVTTQYPILDACDALSLARCSEIYLEALEHYILVNPATELDKQRLLYFLQLYRTESSKGFDQTADILKSALASNWGDND
jgi:uncharacterized protein YjaG (DUF416 family)